MAHKYCIFEPNIIFKRLMGVYSWQQKEWPHFSYKVENVENELFSFAERFGLITGMLKALPEESQMEAVIDIMVSEAIKTSEIEGEFLSRSDVMSSIRNNLGLTANAAGKDKRTMGVSSLMIKVRNTFSEPLSEKTLLEWHSLLMSYRKDLEAGKWRTHNEPMQVVSGTFGKIRIHFEAPPSEMVPEEMKRYIKWFNDTSPGGGKEIKKAPVRSAIAHLYFESIHPFEDGNGRIGRALAEKALSQGLGRPILLSLSKSIDSNRRIYYSELEKAQHSLEIDSWIKYFVNTILAAQMDSENEIDFTLKKVKFFDKFRDQLSERHLTVIRRMLEEGPKGFNGGMNARKYVSLTKISKPTATRDLQYLAEIKAFLVSGGGRSTNYQVNI